MYVSLVIWDVECCLIVESPLYLEGASGLFEFIVKRQRKWAHGYGNCWSYKTSSWNNAYKRLAGHEYADISGDLGVDARM